MLSLLIGLSLARSASAAEAAPCVATELASARHDIVEAREAYAGARADFYDVDWKARFAIADDRDAVMAERKAEWERVRALHDDIADARAAYADVKAKASEGSLACGSPTIPAAG